MSEVEPYGCAVCGKAEYAHGQSWDRYAGFHGWVKPSEEQIKNRMIIRRYLRGVHNEGAGDE